MMVPALLLLLVRHRFAPRWAKQLATCDSVVIGGGALFQDVDQNFPIKIAEALKLANARRLPVAIASVGFPASGPTAGARVWPNSFRRRACSTSRYGTSAPLRTGRRRWAVKVLVRPGSRPIRACSAPGTTVLRACRVRRASAFA
ncbi:hypothetical protein ACFSLT_24845 [Novosphingobium resinovorum]